jgi:hypothetical protein
MEAMKKQMHKLMSNVSMTVRERFHAVMNFQPFDRLPLIEWANWWDKTIGRWYGEGLPEGDRYAISRHFGLDIYYQDWFSSRRTGCPQAPVRGQGIIANEAEYERVRPFLFPECSFEPRRWEQWVAEQARGEAVLWFTLEGFFWFPRELLGVEPHIYAFYDQPDLMHRINHDLSEWALRQIDRVCEICVPDFMTFAEDMSYNHGPMLSEELFDEFMLPYYKKVTARLRKHGIIPIIDSDGDVTIPAPWFERAGLAGVLPLERQAGVDIMRLRQAHPRMLFIGHYDKMVMSQGEMAIRREFERLLSTAATGGFIPSVDHQTPPSVSYKEYLTYLSAYHDFAKKAGQLSRSASNKTEP